MFVSQRKLRRTARVGLVTTALGLALAAGLAGPAMATGNSPLGQPQQLSRADLNTGGANGQCPGGPYCSTRDGSPSLNGNGNGVANGEPCAGCVGKADNKNPQGQMPNGSDHNAGYECDRNHGIGASNPAHTGCTAPVVTPPVVHLPPVVQPVVVPPGAPVVTETSDGVQVAAARPVVKVHAGPVVTETSAGVQIAAAHPLPSAAMAGEASTGGQLTAGGFAALAALLAFGAAFALRRRHGDA